MHDGITGVFPKSAGMLFFGSFIKARAESERLPLVNGVWISPAGPLPDSFFLNLFFICIIIPFPVFQADPRRSLLSRVRPLWLMFSCLFTKHCGVLFFRIPLRGALRNIIVIAERRDFYLGSR